MNLKQETLTRMLLQSRHRAEPLPGKPLVLALRESSKQLDPDQATSWLKLPMDCIVELGFLRDDAADCVDVRALWKKAPPKKGQCIIELWEDKNHVAKKKRRTA